MKKRVFRAFLLVAFAAGLAAGCSKIKAITAPAQTTGSADFSVVAALGTSISAGYQSGGLVDHHQTRSYVSLFAQQVGARPLDLPTINRDGIPPLLKIWRLVPPPVLIAPVSVDTGVPTNFALPSAYHNMAVPGALISDVTDPNGNSLNPYFGLIARGRGSIARQIGTLIDPPPTFLLFEFGANEVLYPATHGTTAGLEPPAIFAALLSSTLDTLATLLPSAKMAIVNVPDVTAIPFVTTLSNKVLDAAGNPVLDANGKPRFLLGPGGAPLTNGDHVLLTAATALAVGEGYPLGTVSYLSGLPEGFAGTGRGLDDALVLSAGETSAIHATAVKFNGVIDTSAARRGLAVVDLNGLLLQAATTGIDIRGSLYSSAFITGGLFSLDGVHPNDLAHALICNQVIAAVNAKFGSNIQPLDRSRFGTLTSSRARGALGEEGGRALLEGVGVDAILPWRSPPLP